jgi:hypothetical protein
VQLRPPQRLVGVDVADAAHQGLVEQRPLDAGAPAPDGGDEGVVVEVRVDRVTGDVRDHRRHRVAARYDQQPAEGALVDEAQLPAAVGEAQPHVQVLLQRAVARHDEQLPAHAEVPGQGVAGVQRQPQVLAPPLRRQDGAPGEPADEVVGTRSVPAHRARVRDLHLLDRASRDAALQPEPDGLDLGQLRH